MDLQYKIGKFLVFLPRAPKSWTISFATGGDILLGELQPHAQGDINSLPSSGTAHAAIDHLFETAFSDLQKLAAAIMSRERPGHTLQPAALVNEAYLRLVGTKNLAIGGRIHFINLAARAMRRILVEHARRFNSLKRGGGRIPVSLHDITVGEFPDHVAFIDLEAAMQEFAKRNARSARVAELRIFTGLDMVQIAEALGVSRRTVQADWREASMWMRRALSSRPLP